MSERAEPISGWSFAPVDLLRGWPRREPLVALCSAPSPGTDRRWAGWSYLASPAETITIGPEEPDPLGRLAAIVGRPRVGVGAESSPMPFCGGWIIALGYETGRSIEPTAAVHPSRARSDWPWSIVLWRCPTVLGYDHGADRWWRAGPITSEASGDEAGGYSLGTPRPTIERNEYLAAARRAVEYVHAGDVFQVNLAHHLEAEFTGSTRALFADMLHAAGPWYGAYLELLDRGHLHAALSISPELFLSLDGASRRVITRPIKGTRRASIDPAALRDSAKDQAELNMIVDLMRNDLGRVCEIGSVRVAEARAIETHGAASGVHHGVATIEGKLRPDRSIADLLRATFPGGSITGAPKVRAMQIIEELELSPRGLYTGAIGYISSDTGNMALNIAIRTAIIRGTRTNQTGQIDELLGARLTYGVGAGIVADSVPEAEWDETLDKAGTLLNLAAIQNRTIVTRPTPHHPRVPA